MTKRGSFGKPGHQKRQSPLPRSVRTNGNLAVSPWASAAALAGLAVAAYWPALGGGFIWDDIYIYIVHNPLLRASDGLYRFWFTSEPIDYYPLTYSTFWFAWRLWGLSPAGYHAVNVLLHALCAILLWRLLRRLEVPGAWIAAAIFVVHPVNVDAVAWICQRKSLLAATLGFASLGAFLHFEETRRRSWLTASLALYALSLAAKPTLIALPLLLLGYRSWTHGRVGWQDVLETAPYLALSVLFGLIGVWFQQQRAIGMELVRDQPLLLRIATGGCAFWFYLWKAVTPLQLSFVYPRWQLDPNRLSTYLPVLGLVATVAIAWYGRRGRGRPLAAALGFYLLTLAPALGLVDVYFWRYAFVADHYQYQSIIAVIALLTGVAVPKLRQFADRNPAWRTAVLAVGVAVLAGLASQTIRQSSLCIDEMFLWQDVIAKNDRDFLGRNNLGLIYLDQGRHEEAIALFRKSIAANPDFWEVYNSIGLYWSAVGDYAAAEGYFAEAARRAPHHATVRLNLDGALLDQKQFDAALAQFEEAVRLAPDNPDARRVLERVRQTRRAGRLQLKSFSQ
ncbi:MAG: tetratricopeptide repeat protein [Rhodopirellula sp.]|nr:tetratricopeptide repeat protein [Rhodopirellula sp.]